jgi:hypothetical protein
MRSVDRFDCGNCRQCNNTVIPCNNRERSVIEQSNVTAVTSVPSVRSPAVRQLIFAMCNHKIMWTSLEIQRAENAVREQVLTPPRHYRL